MLADSGKFNLPNCLMCQEMLSHVEEGAFVLGNHYLQRGIIQRSLTKSMYELISLCPLLLISTAVHCLD